MFDLVTGKAKHIPSTPAVSIVISSTAQAVVVALLMVPVLLVTGTLPEVPTMMAFVAAPPPSPPPPPPPPPAAPKPARAPEAQPVPTSGAAAPVEAPAAIVPEPVADIGDEGVPGGVEGGVPGGVLGGVVGGLPEEIPPPPPPAPPARRDPVRVGGQIKEPQLVQRVEPVYHPLAVRANIQGTVILEAIVDKDGRVAEVRVLRSVHRMLDDAGVEAVRQWRYVPLVLNGIPERFVLTVVLTFNLTQQASGD
jgi:protein TonB